MILRQSPPPIYSTICVCLFAMIFSQSINAQADNKEIMAAFEDANRAVITGDSALYFSIFSSNHILIHGGIGQEFDLNKSWPFAKRMGSTPEMKAICDIVSMDVKGSVAWITYHYTYTVDDSLQKTVNLVEDYKDYEWIGTLIFIKNGGQWQNVHWHTSPGPKK